MDLDLDSGSGSGRRTHQRVVPGELCWQSLLFRAAVRLRRPPWNVTWNLCYSYGVNKTCQSPYPLPGVDIPQHDDCSDNSVNDAGDCSLDTESFSATSDPGGGYDVSWSLSAPIDYAKDACTYPCTGMFEYDSMGTYAYATVSAHT